VVVTDLNMSGMSGLQLCERVVAAHPDVPVVVITAFGSLDAAIGAIRAGAYDFLIKPFEIAVMALVLERAVQHRQLRAEVKRLRATVAESRHFAALLGSSTAMQRVYALLDRIAQSDASVLVVVVIGMARRSGLVSQVSSFGSSVTGAGGAGGSSSRSGAPGSRRSSW